MAQYATCARYAYMKMLEYIDGVVCADESENILGEATKQIQRP